MHGALRSMSRKERRASPEGRLLREVRKAEAAATEDVHSKIRRGEIKREKNDGAVITGTGFTILKLQQKPLQQLIDSGKISGPEHTAAQEIERAIFAIQSGGRLSGMVLERVDRGASGDSPWPAYLAEIVKRYQAWANHWSNEHKRTGNPMLEVIWSAVIDERPFYIIAQDVNCGRKRAERAVICGLRHYAAWAGFVSGNQATQWFDAAQGVFSRDPADAGI